MKHDFLEVLFLFFSLFFLIFLSYSFPLLVSPPFVFSQTLPADRVSTENGAIVMSSGRWPLLVDPQLQAIHWLKGMYQDKVDVVRLSSVDLLRKMSTAIKEGRTIIIENMLEDFEDNRNNLFGEFKNPQNCFGSLGFQGCPYLCWEFGISQHDPYRFWKI